MGTLNRLFQAASSALSSLGHVYTAIGDYPNALASHKQCVLLAKQSKDELSEARELGNMGAVYIAMGDFENAVQCHEQHLKIAKDLGNKREEARAYSNLGSAYHYRRNFDKAMSYHNYVLELAQELMEKAIEMRAYAGLGHAARCMQDLERAKQYHEQQLGIAEDLKDRAAEGRASSNLDTLHPSVVGHIAEYWACNSDLRLSVMLKVYMINESTFIGHLSCLNKVEPLAALGRDSEAHQPRGCVCFTSGFLVESSIAHGSVLARLLAKGAPESGAFNCHGHQRCAIYSFYSFEEHGGELAGVEGSYWRDMEDEVGWFVCWKVVSAAKRNLNLLCFCQLPFLGSLTNTRKCVSFATSFASDPKWSLLSSMIPLKALTDVLLAQQFLRVA
ncbi:hypothetical protein PANDA_020278 [Ailuropoda melanoleuca]|uniref:Uncharacterized protein n=1 Tax=Ailuropoda melanoleuca TaxID=9646 RepID=D2I3Z2_AILME|nr:hypothetical protein PANDA_020278 [Ailuropoda melanoleuca]